MKKIHYLATFLALLFFCTTARAGIQASSDYLETFDKVDVSAHDFAPAFWGHIVESYFDYDYYEEYYVKYQHYTSGGFDGKGYLSAGTQSLGSGWTTSDVNDLLVSPKVSGEISFYLKKAKSSGKIRLFSCTSKGNGFSKGTEIKIDNMPTLSTDAWTQVTLTVAEPTHIGIRLEDMAIDNFHAQAAEIVAKKSIEIKSAKHMGSSDLMANADNQVEVVFNVTIKNTGDAVLNPGDEDYSISLVGYQNPEIELGRKDIDVSLEPGQTSGTIEMRILCDAGTSKKNNRYDIRENINGTTAFGAWITFIPYVPELKVYDSSSSTIDQPVDFEIVQKQEHSLLFQLANNGGAPLDITAIDAPEGFEFSSPLPIHLDNGQKSEMTITLKPGDTWTGSKDGQIVFHYNDTYQTELPVKGTVLHSSVWYEDFEAGIPTDIIHAENWENAPTNSSPLTTVFNKKWAQNKVQDPLTDMISPKLHVNENDSLVFYAAKRTNYGGELVISYSSDRKDWTEVRHLKYNASNAEDKFSEEKASYSGNDYKFTRFVVKNIPAGDFYVRFSAGFVYLDNIYGFQKKLVKHDLYMQGSDIPNHANVNNTYTATVSLLNLGEAETAGSYSVKMLSGTEVLAEAVTPDFEAYATQNFELTFTPHQEGELPVVVVIETAETRTEAVTDTITVNPESAELIQTVGKNQKTNNKVPLALNYKKSISETVYTSQMLGIENNSEIVRLSYLFCNKSDKKFPANIKIWMENTTDSLFESETITAADTLQMEQVYHGFWNIQAEGSEQELVEKVFTLNKPFVYTGNNLRVVISSEASQYCSVSFASEAVQVATSIQKYSDNNLIEASWSKSSYLPVTNFYLKQEVPTISGTIKDQLTGKVMPDIHLTLTSGDVLYEGTTNAEGVYSIPVIQAYNTYTLSIEAEGYTPFEQKVSFDGSNIQKDIELMRVMPEEPQDCTAKFMISTVTGESAKNATISLYHNEFGLDYGTKTVNANGFCMFNLVSGYYTIQIEKKGFKKYVNDHFAIPGNIEFNITLEEDIVDPYALEANLQHDILTGQNDIEFSWNQEGPAFFDDFENYEDFSIAFGEWTGVDRDGEAAAALSGSYKNRGMQQYATICNPLTVTPAWWYDYPVLRAYSGQQYVGFIRTQSGVENDDWLISPKITVGTNHILRFMAKSGDQFKERFQVGISAGSKEPDDFIILSGGNYETVGYEEWQEMIYDLSAYEGQEVYIAIHYVSKAYFMLMIDDFYVGPNNIQELVSQRAPQRSQANPHETFEIYLDGNKVAETDNYSYIFSNVAEGNHTLGVKARYQISESKLSTYEINVPAKDNYASLNVNITTNNEQVINQEKMELVNKSTGTEYLLTIENNHLQATSIPKGTYLTSIDVDNYDPYQQEIQLEQDIELTVDLKETLVTPFNLTIDLTEDESGQMNALFQWNQDLGFSDSFETYEDFSSNFGDWTVLNLDKMPVYPIALGDISNVISFPGSGTAESPAATKTMVFNPYKTTPSMESDPNILAPDGKKTVIFFSSQRAESDDWLISPIFKIHENYVWQVTAKAYDMFPEFIEFAISTSKEPETFAVIDKVQLTKEWTKYSIDLSAYAGQEVYLGIHYITNDGFLSQIDQFYVGPDKEAGNAATVGLVDHYEVMLDNVVVAQPTTNQFLFEDVTEGAHTASVKAVYKSGESETASITFNAVSGIDELLAGNKITGCRGYISCELAEQASIHVYDASGKLAASDLYEAGTSTVQVPAGIYIVRIASEGNVQNQKVRVF